MSSDGLQDQLVSAGDWVKRGLRGLRALGCGLVVILYVLALASATALVVDELLVTLKAPAGDLLYTPPAATEKTPTAVQAEQKGDQGQLLSHGAQDGNPNHGKEKEHLLWLRLIPPELILLLPGVLVLSFRALYDCTFRVQSQQESSEDQPDPNAWLIIVTVLIWFFTFYWLHLLQVALKVPPQEGLVFFHKTISFPLFVPLLGFLGSIIFVVDLLRKRSQKQGKGVDAVTEFALRLVLGPYVAIAVVVLMKWVHFLPDTNGDVVVGQAALAFFSGFLAVLALQNLTERANEALGRWREQNRYTPSEIRDRFSLDQEDDAKLRKAGLKYCDQLRTLPDSKVEEAARESGLPVPFLRELQRRLRADELQERMGKNLWQALQKHEVKDLPSLAVKPTAWIQSISASENLSAEVVEKFQQEARVLVKRP